MPISDKFDVTKNDGELQKSMTTFSGCDIKCYFEDVEIGNMQGISLSINREVRPVFVMGNSDVVSYSRGKRGVAGSLILTVFDRDAFLHIKEVAQYVAKKSEVSGDSYGGRTGVRGPVSGVGGELLSPKYADQIPPFNVTLVAINEFGNAMVMRIHGIHIVSEGQGMSVDDNVAESQFTFVAHGVEMWKPIEPINNTTGIGTQFTTTKTVPWNNLGLTNDLGIIE